MLGRLMAPAFDKMAAIDLKNFVRSITMAEYAIKVTITNLKQEFFGGFNGGVV